MQVASLELCKELYELSGWEPDDKFWFSIDGKHSVHCGHEFKKELIEFKYSLARICPAYDLGYLLRKLPPIIQLGRSEYYNCSWTNGNDSHVFVADTPENAVCKLAIELFKSGILAHTADGGKDSE
jgi:hypothetical protein